MVACSWLRQLILAWVAGIAALVCVTNSALADEPRLDCVAACRSLGAGPECEANCARPPIYDRSATIDQKREAARGGFQALVFAVVFFAVVIYLTFYLIPLLRAHLPPSVRRTRREQEQEDQREQERRARAEEEAQQRRWWREEEQARVRAEEEARRHRESGRRPETRKTVEDALEFFGLAPDATWPEVEKRYKQRAREFHPDVHENHRRAAWATKKTATLNDYREVLRTHFSARR